MRVVRSKRRTAKVTAAFVSILSTLTVSGCSILNPHVSPAMKRPTYGAASDIQISEVVPTNDAPNDKPASGENGGDQQIRFAGNVGEAIDYANSWREAYYEAVGHQSWLRSGTALAVAPIGAAALFLGITSSSRLSRDVVTGLAAGGAMALGLGTYFESKDRQRIYLAGSQAVGCAILATTPWIIPEDQFRSFDQQRQSLPTYINEVRVLLGVVEANIKKVSGKAYASEAITLAEEQIARSQQVLIRAEELLPQADNTVADISIVGARLVTQVDTIRDKVSDQIVKTEPDIASIGNIVHGIEGAARKIAPIPEQALFSKKTEKELEATLENQAEEDLDLEALVNSTVKLSEQTLKLEKAVTQISLVVNRVAVVQERIGKIEECNLANVEIGLRIEPPEQQVELTPGDEYPVLLSGGKRPYSARLVGARVPDGVELVRGGFDESPVVALVATDAQRTKEGSFALAVNDASGENAKLIRFSVRPKSNGSTNTKQPPNSGISDTEAFTETEIKIVQCALGLAKEDGILGPDTRTVIRAYQLQKGKEKAAGALTPELLSEIQAVEPSCVEKHRGVSDAEPVLDMPVPPPPSEPEVPDLPEAPAVPPGNTGLLDPSSNDVVGAISDYERGGDLIVKTVMDIQQALKTKGVAPDLEITGTLDTATREAIAKLQTPSGVRRDPDPQLLTEDMVTYILNADRLN